MIEYLRIAGYDESSINFWAGIYFSQIRERDSGWVGVLSQCVKTVVTWAKDQLCPLVQKALNVDVCTTIRGLDGCGHALFDIFGSLPDTARSLLNFSNATAGIKTLMTAGQGAFSEFANDLPQHIKKALEEWVNLRFNKGGAGISAATIGRLVGAFAPNFKPTEFINAILDAFGYDIDGITKLAQEKGLGQAVGLIMTAGGVLDSLAKHGSDLEKGVSEIVAWVSDMLGDKLDGTVTELLSKLKENVKDHFIEFITTYLPVDLLTKLATKLGESSNPAGWAVWIFRILEGIASRCTDMVELLSSALQAVKDAIEGKNTNTIKTTFLGMIQKGLRVLIELVARVLGITDLFDKIGKFLVNVKTTAQKPLSKLFDAVWKFVSNLLSGIINTSFGLTKNVLVFPRRSKPARSVAQVAIKEDGTVLVARSKAKKYDELDKKCRDATQAQFDAVEKAKKEHKSANKKEKPAKYKVLVDAVQALANAIAQQCIGECPKAGDPALKPRSLGTRPVNVPWFTNDVIRAEGAVAIITKESIGKGSEFNRGRRRNPVWWGPLNDNFPPSEGDQWERGHLIGDQLGGPGKANWWNMVPIHAKANDPGMKFCENKVREAVEEGDCVQLKVIPFYGPTRQVVPLHIIMSAVSLKDGKTILNLVKIPNRSEVKSPCPSKISSK